MAKLMIAGAVGVADEGLEYWDRESGRTEHFRNATDLGRIGMVAAGVGMQMFMPRQARLGEVISTASTPLLVKSVSSYVRSGSSQAAGRGIPRSTFTPRGAPMGAGGPVGRHYQPEFQGNVSW